MEFNLVKRFDFKPMTDFDIQNRFDDPDELDIYEIYRSYILGRVLTNCTRTDRREYIDEELIYNAWLNLSDSGKRRWKKVESAMCKYFST